MNHMCDMEANESLCLYVALAVRHPPAEPYHGDPGDSACGVHAQDFKRVGKSAHASVRHATLTLTLAMLQAHMNGCF
ncbi:hypothetical protein J6590_022729 [Homalodisca vitripennis]|nr:hypothetical protein J6590_022729 [Homalodisca vitripennis]